MSLKLLTAAAVREALGGVSYMTLWRWLKDPAVDFPKPIYISKRRYWRDADILDWLKSQAELEP